MLYVCHCVIPSLDHNIMGSDWRKHAIALGKSTSQRIAPSKAASGPRPAPTLVLHRSPWVYMYFHCHQMMIQAWAKATQLSSEVTQKLRFFSQPMLP